MRALCLALVLATAGCCSSGARDRAARYAEINRQHAADESLPLKAREVADDNRRAWLAQWRVLGGKSK